MALLAGLGAALLLERRRLRHLGRNSRGLIRAYHAELLVKLALHVGEDLRMQLEKVARVLAALPDALAAVAEPGAALLDDVVLHRQIEQVSLAGDALAIKDVELDLAEWRRHLVLHHLHPRAIADHRLAVLDGADPADVEPLRGVELERVAAGGGLRVAEHHADLHADLVDEDDGGVGLADGGGELAQGLRHQPRLQAHVLVAHLAFQLGARDQCGDAVDDDQIHGPGAHQHLADLQRLLAGIGMRDQEILGADPELARVADVERVLGVDEGGDAARLRRLGDHVQGQRGLAPRLRAVDLDDAAAGNAADAEREVERDAPGRDRRDVLHQWLVVAETHDGAFAELLLDGRNGKLDRLLFFRVRHSFPPLGSTVRLYRSVSLGARCHPGLTRPRSRQETLLKPRITFPRCRGARCRRRGWRRRGSYAGARGRRTRYRKDRRGGLSRPPSSSGRLRSST